MRRLLSPLLVALLLVPSLSTAQAQEADMQYFDSFDGLERVVGRAWMAPVTMVSSTSGEPVVVDDESTPPTRIRISEPTPAATPEPQSGIGMLSVFVFLFDSDDNAATGFDRIDADLQEQQERDPRAPMMDDLPLDGIGDRARGYMGELTQDDITLAYTFATVQDGSFVYSIAGTFAAVDAETLTTNYAESLTAAPMDRMAEQYDQEGDSRGGLWSKLNAVEPEMPPDSTITDLIVYPMEDVATPVAPVPETPRLDLDDPASIEGLESLEFTTYVPADGAAPTPDVPGTFRIDAWVLTFDSTDAASTATTALGNTLIEPFGITSGGSSGGDVSTRTSYFEGFIDDRSLPPGNGIVSILQFDESVYAVVVYAIDEDPKPVADAFMREFANNSAVPPQDRFPSTGDPVLEGLVPAETASPAGTPAATPVS